jgi:hypothetical protein
MKTNNSCNLWQWFNEFIAFTCNPGLAYYAEFFLISMLAMIGIVMILRSHDIYATVIGIFALVQFVINFISRLLMPFVHYERPK